MFSIIIRGEDKDCERRTHTACWLAGLHDNPVSVFGRLSNQHSTSPSGQERKTDRDEDPDGDKAAERTRGEEQRD